MDSNLRNKTIIGSFWALFERFGYLVMQFVSNIVLARLLMPDDFGTIGILLIFVTISEVLVDGGFSTALIQRKNITNVDKSTVFYTNLSISCFIYLIVYLFSPWISTFFKSESLILLLRIIEIKIVLDALGAVQFALMRRNMNFKAITLIRILSILFAVIIAIIFAFFDFGVWSLVIQNLSFSLISVILVWKYSNWRPQLVFSRNSLSYLFGYGSKLMIQHLLGEIYENFQSVLIGRYFLAKDLGFFTQAKQLQQVPVKSLTNVVTSVSFPAFSKLQDEKETLKRVVKKNLNVLLFINTPLMCFLAVLAKPIISFVYSDKWLPSVPYFQLLCLGFGTFLVIHQCNLSILKAVGRSDYVLNLEIIKKVLGFCLLIIGMKLWGIWGILYGLIANSFVEMFMNGFYVNKEVRYGIWEQFKDLLRSFIYSILPTIVIFLYLQLELINSNLVNVLFCSFVFWIIYYCVAKTMKSDSLIEVERIVKEYIFEKFKNNRNAKVKRNCSRI